MQGRVRVPVVVSGIFSSDIRTRIAVLGRFEIYLEPRGTLSYESESRDRSRNFSTTDIPDRGRR